MELDSDVRKSLAARKSAENHEKPKKNPNFFPILFFCRRQKKSKFANRLKRALQKLRGDRSQVRGVNGHSKFEVAADVRWFVRAGIPVPGYTLLFTPYKKCA